MDARRAKEKPGVKQRYLVTQARAMLKRKKRKLAKLKSDVFFLEKFIYNSEVNTLYRKQHLNKEKHRSTLLNSVMEIWRYKSYVSQ